MADVERGSLGKASLELTADLGEFEANVKSSERTSPATGCGLKTVAAVAG